MRAVFFSLTPFVRRATRRGGGRGGRGGGVVAVVAAAADRIVRRARGTQQGADARRRLPGPRASFPFSSSTILRFVGGMVTERRPHGQRERRTRRRLGERARKGGRRNPQVLSGAGGFDGTEGASSSSWRNSHSQSEVVALIFAKIASKYPPHFFHSFPFFNLAIKIQKLVG